MYYSSFGVLALILTFVINHHILYKKITGNGVQAKIRYRHFLWCAMLYYFVDALWGIFYSQHLIGLAYADTIAYFFLMAIAILLWTQYVVAYLERETVFTKIVTYSGLAFLMYAILALIINIFVPVAFYFDAEGIYHPGYLRYITLTIELVFFLVCAIYTMIITLKTYGRRKRHNYAVCMSSFTMIVFVLLQTFFPFAPFFAIGILIATCVVHTFIVIDDMKDYGSKIDAATQKMYTDPLTGVKSNHAYLAAVAKINECISNNEIEKLGVIIFDLNGLKKVNDTKGHEAGNRYIQVASQLICRYFKHSPVYRVGGDEFVVLLRGEDYHNRISILEAFDKRMEMNAQEGYILVIASGYSDYVKGKDKYYGVIFDHADHKMYERKVYLKELAKNKNSE